MRFCVADNVTPTFRPVRSGSNIRRCHDAHGLKQAFLQDYYIAAALLTSNVDVQFGEYN